MADLQDNTTLTAGSNQVVHLDLFSGIGGFAYAIDQVWDNVVHTFCDNEPFAQKVIAKHWPESEIYSDIKEIIADTFYKGLEGSSQKAEGHARQPSGKRPHKTPRPFIVTGGFPCQPYSAAGLRRGTADDRHLWPEMLRVIRLTNPEWVIAENVRGLATWNEGLVLEQVCTDLETSGYEVQPFIIPAVAVNAPHRRDRIWFVAHALDSGQGQPQRKSPKTPAGIPQEHRPEDSTTWQPKRTDSNWGFDTSDWEKDWMEVAAEFCRVDDGLPDRVHRIKALGNAIVPEVAEQLIRGIDLVATDTQSQVEPLKSAINPPSDPKRKANT